MRYALTIAVAALAMVAPAEAQIGNPGFFAAGTKVDEAGIPLPGQPNNTDVLFARLLFTGGLAEIDFGNLSATKAESQAVQDFATRMVEDHGAVNEELAATAGPAGIELPQALTPEQERMRSELEDEEGREFDLVYIRGQIIEHQKAAQLLTWEIDGGQEGALQRFASETLPKVLEHLQLAKSIQAELTGSSP